MTISSMLHSFSSISPYSLKNNKTGKANDATASVPSKSAILEPSLQISDEANRLYEQSRQDNSKNPDWATDTTITTSNGEVIKTQWIDVNKMLNEKLSAEDKRILGFPLEGKGIDDFNTRILLGQAIVNMHDLGALNGKITKSFLLGNGMNQLDLANNPNYQSAEAHAALMDILSRTSA